MTPGSMQVVPVNTVERAFNVLCLMMGVIFFGSLISTLSSKMLHYRMTRRGHCTLRFGIPLYCPVRLVLF